MNAQPVLSFEEITAVDTIEGLVGLYSQKGHSFPDQKAFIAAVKKDWAAEQKRVFREAMKKEPPLKPSSLDAVIGGATVSIYGVVHKPELGKKFAQTVADVVNSGGNWLFEQNLKSDFRKAKGGTEIPDHSLFYGREIFADNLKEFLGGLIIFPLLPLVPVALSVYCWEKLKKGDKDSSLKYLNVPLRAWAKPLPAYVDIGLREQHTKPKYDSTQRRSAYQAEFVRAWKKGEQRSIVVGAAHVPQIEYFLKHGVKDKKVIEMANQHVALLEYEPGKLLRVRRNAEKRYSAFYFLGAAAGGALLTAFINGAYALYHAVNAAMTR